MAVVLVLHTTESDNFDAQVGDFLRNPGKQPHRLIDPVNGRYRDFIDPGTFAKALKNLPGGVETNRRAGGVLQVEIMGRAALVPTYSDVWYLNLAKMLVPFCTENGVPILFPYSFNNPRRLSFDEWNNVRGIIGHCHVPENDHTDPGNITRLISYMITAPEAAMKSHLLSIINRGLPGSPSMTHYEFIALAYEAAGNTDIGGILYWLDEVAGAPDKGVTLRTMVDQLTFPL